MEIWKDIDGFVGKFQVSNLGNIKGLRRTATNYQGVVSNIPERILKLQLTNNGYCHIALNDRENTRQRLVHRLVAEAFIPNPENKSEVNHIDGDKTNNVVENLEWATASENQTHSYRVLKRKRTTPMKGKLGKEHHTSIPVCQYNPQGEFIAEWAGAAEAARYTNCSNVGINYCCKGKLKTSGGFIWRYRD
jgi:hypothetical protein